MSNDYNIGGGKSCFMPQEFLGHQINELGITAAQDKVEAVLQMCSLSKSKELKRVLGMVDYIRKFDPGLA